MFCTFILVDYNAMHVDVLLSGLLFDKCKIFDPQKIAAVLYLLPSGPMAVSLWRLLSEESDSQPRCFHHLPATQEHLPSQSIATTHKDTLGSSTKIVVTQVS